MGSPLLATCRLLSYLVFTVALMPVQATVLAIGWHRASVGLPRFYHRCCAWMLGFIVEQRGMRATGPATLFVVNHCSYLDITLLGAAVPGSFIAKAEVARWPLFGWLAKLQRTVFVERERRTRAAAQRDEVTRRLEAGDSLILFPEGTSSDGNRILPFKTALFSVAERRIDGHAIVVQPVTIAYVRLDGMPIGHALRPLFAWYGDMDMAGHIWRAAGLGDCTVSIEFHPPVTIEAFGSRKALAEHCRAVISEGMTRAITGRWPDAAPPRPAPPELPARPAEAI
ncbi:MAG: lysophospholipid acyltransferase family protein [Alphaproteobacteria bacterium]